MNKCKVCKDLISDEFEICYNCSNPSESKDEVIIKELTKKVFNNYINEIEDDYNNNKISLDELTVLKEKYSELDDDEKSKVDNKKSSIKYTETEISSQNLWVAIYNVPLGMKIYNKPRKKLASDDIHPYWLNKGIKNPYSMAVFFSVIRIIFFTIAITIVNLIGSALGNNTQPIIALIILGVITFTVYLGWLFWFVLLIKYIFQRIFYKVK